MMCTSSMLQGGNNVYSIFGIMNIQLQEIGLKLALENHSWTQ